MTQRQKNIRGLIMSGILLVAVLAWQGWEYRSEIQAKADRSKFAIPDATRISKVELQSSQDTVHLEFDGTRWQVNQAWPADRQMITVFFATLAQVETKRPAEASRADSLRNSIQQEGVHVRLSEADGRTVDFRVSSSSPTYFMSEEYPIPELVTLPGYRVDVSAIFRQTTAAWRDRRIFNFNWQNFRSLRATFPKEANDFTIQSVNGVFTVPDMPTDTARMNEYLDAISLLQADQILSPDRSRDSLFQYRSPEVKISVEDLAGRAYELEVWANPDGSNSKIGRWQGEAVLFNALRGRLLLTTRTALQRRPQ